MKFNVNTDIDNYSPSTPGRFVLKKNGDKARVRFMYETINDVGGHSVHKVKLPDGSFRWVECLREYGDPAELCPLCDSPDYNDKKLSSKIWVPLYNEDTQEVVTWERGKKFWSSQLYPLMVERGEPFCGNVFVITRVGEPGDIETTYEITFDECDGKILEDLDEMPSMENVVLEKTFEELQKFVKTRSFDDAATDQVFSRRRGATSNNNGESEAPELPRRRGTARPDIV